MAGKWSTFRDDEPPHKDLTSSSYMLELALGLVLQMLQSQHPHADDLFELALNRYSHARGLYPTCFGGVESALRNGGLPGIALAEALEKSPPSLAAPQGRGQPARFSASAVGRESGKQQAELIPCYFGGCRQGVCSSN